MKRVLTIGHSDSSSASGVQLDLRVFAQCGVFGTSAITLLAAQDTYAVRKVFRLAPSIVGAQIDAAAADIAVDACKVGWYRSPELTTVIAGRIRRRELHPVVLDPCLWSERGELLTPPRTVKRIVQELLPLVDVVTVTVRELGILAGRPADGPGGLGEAAERLRAIGPAAVVVEDVPCVGGTAAWVWDGDGGRAVAERAVTVVAAGMGGAFSAALAAGMALGRDAVEAARQAAFLTDGATRRAQAVGKGLPVLLAPVGQSHPASS